MGFFWLSAFYLVYCARPEDWIKAISIIPLAKITGVGAILAFLFSAGKGKRKFKDLPVESYYLLAMLAVLMLSSIVSPVWRGGAIPRTLDFSKVYIVWVLTFLLVTDIPKFRRILFIQAASVPVICLVSMVKGRGTARLDGVLGGIYSNPNDLAFAIVLSLPFCLMFMLTAKGGLRKMLWVAGMLVMCKALFMTASRGGFITLVVSGAVCMWHFGIRGKRLHLIAGSALVLVILLATSGSGLIQRFSTIWGDAADVDTRQERSAADSYEQRQYLVGRALQGIKEYPILGMGTRNFETYSMVWREVHMTYLQIAVEGGFVSLILYLLFIAKGFSNLKWLLRRKDLSPDLRLFAGALHSSLIGFAVGALFSPEAYQFFPYFTVAYTAALAAYMKECDRINELPVAGRTSPLRALAEPAGFSAVR
jgi:hypothetical protein